MQPQVSDAKQNPGNPGERSSQLRQTNTIFKEGVGFFAAGLNSSTIIKNEHGIQPNMKLIQLVGKSIYANRWKIRKNTLSSLSFLTYKH